MAKLGMRMIFLLMAIMLMAVGLYQRVWVVQMDLSTERHNRNIYQKLYSEALDEVADWRKKYDAEVSNCDGHLQRLHQMTEAVRENDHKLELLQNENKLLQEEKSKLSAEIARLTRELQKKETSNLRLNEG